MLSTRAGASLALCLSCTEVVTSVSGVRAEFRISQTAFRVGDSVVATLSVRNHTDNAVVLRSGDSCLAVLTAWLGGERVDLKGTAFGCFAVVSSFTVPANDSLVLDFPIVAILNEGKSPWRYIVPPPTGDYELRATMHVNLSDQKLGFAVVP